MQRHSPSGRRGLGFCLAATTMVLWGFLPLALKALLEKLDAETIVSFRFLCSAVLVGVLLGIKGKLPRLRSLTLTGRWLLAIAIIGLGANYFAYMVGLNLTTPAVSQVVIQLAPPILTIGGLIFFRERFTPLQWLGFFVLLGGLSLFFIAQIEVIADDLASYYRGVSWVVAAALSWAAYGLAQKQLLLQLPSQAIMICVYAVCAIALAPLASPASLSSLNAVEWGLLIFVAINTALAYGCFSEALEHWEASRVSAVLSLTPLATIGFTRVAHGISPQLFPADPLAPWAIVGAVAVIAGSMLVALARRGSPRPSSASRPVASGLGLPTPPESPPS